MSTLAHLTLATGHLRMSPRAEVGPEALAILAPIVRAGAGLVPGMPGVQITIRRPGSGQALIIIHAADGLTYIVAGLAWSQDAADALWPTLIEMVRDAGAAHSVLRRPDHLPWLAVALTPATVMLGREKIGMLGDLERCLAWAILEARP